MQKRTTVKTLGKPSDRWNPLTGSCAIPYGIARGHPCIHQSYFVKTCPGGGALRYRGGPHLRYVFRERRGLFLRPLHVRDFVKEEYFFVPRYEVWGQNPLTIHEINAALTPSNSRSDWASESAAATCCR